MRKMATVRYVINYITYTTEGRDGTRYEQRTERIRDYPLTRAGAERILRADNPDRPSLRVVSVQPMRYER